MLIETFFRMSYPAMSAYEFDNFRQDSAVHSRWETSSIYMICQRPVLYFSNVIPDQNEIRCDIRQRGSDHSVRIRLPILSGRPYFGDSAELICEPQFYDAGPHADPPYDNVAGFKFFDDTGTFSGWLSPERFIYGFLVGRVTADMQGDLASLLRYQVHYIGKAQDQPIWTRLARHESFQSVLSRQFPLIAGEIPAHEIALLFFELHEATTFPFGLTEDGTLIDFSENPISSEDAAIALNKDYISMYSQSIVTDAEAYLINFMLPRYNRIQYKAYPKIAGGLREHGFDAVHTIVPFATLVTEEATIECTFESDAAPTD